MSTNFLQNLEILKYPRTPHMEGSRLQAGDEGYEHVPYSRIAGRYGVLEEKIDAANSAESFSPGGELLLQSRGHYLMGGGSERQFGLYKRWAAAHEDRLLSVLEDRYVMYGEWAHKKHSIFYDNLPAYFNEFDIWDRSREVFLDTEQRHQLLSGVPVLPVPVLYRGILPPRLEDLFELVRQAWRPDTLWPNELMPGKPKKRSAGQAPNLADRLFHSLGKTPRWRENFENTVNQAGYDLQKCWSQADQSDKLEGLYIKIEENGEVVERYKWVRADFVQSILDSKVHHAKQPFIPNGLAPGVDIFAPELSLRWEDLGLKTVEGF